LHCLGSGVGGGRPAWPGGPGGAPAGGGPPGAAASCLKKFVVCLTSHIQGFGEEPKIAFYAPVVGDRGFFVV